MSYFLGVDLGTTYSAAATRRGDHTAISALSDRSPMVPSVLLLRDDDSILVGDAANRRAVVEPDRVAREFKRRFGDPAPLIVGGSPYGADLLTARLLRWVVDLVAEREGGMPDGIALTHPANWGNYKLDLLHQAVRRADLDDGAPCVTLSEPQAAATWYARYERVEPGTVVAVYDLGGGTFDAAVLRRTADGFDLLGTPEGIERLGGVDFDAAVFDHVVATLGDAWDALDEDDPQVRAAVARLRQECVEAKEALSGDSQASIPVVLPGLHTDVRLTRSEFEAMVRPTLADTVVALRRALRSAELEPEEVDKVLLVGGSSRIPLVAEVVGAELGRPIAVDAHPKHAVALGAAVAAAAASTTTPGAVPVVPLPGPDRVRDATAGDRAEARAAQPSAGRDVAPAAAAGAAAPGADAAAAGAAAAGAAPATAVGAGTAAPDAGASRLPIAPSSPGDAREPTPEAPPAADAARPAPGGHSTAAREEPRAPSAGRGGSGRPAEPEPTQLEAAARPAPDRGPTRDPRPPVVVPAPAVAAPTPTHGHPPTQGAGPAQAGTPPGGRPARRGRRGRRSRWRRVAAALTILLLLGAIVAAAVALIATADDDPAAPPVVSAQAVVSAGTMP